MDKNSLIKTINKFKKIMKDINKTHSLFKLVIDTSMRNEYLILSNTDICEFFNINEDIIFINNIETLKRYKITDEINNNISTVHIGTILCAILNSKEEINNIIKKYRDFLNKLKNFKEENQFIAYLYNLINELIHCQAFLALLLPTIAKSYDRIIHWKDYDKDYMLDIHLDYHNIIRSILHLLLGEIQLQLDYLYMFLDTDFPLKKDGHQSLFDDGFYISNVSIRCQKIKENEGIRHITFHNSFCFTYTYTINTLTDFMYVYVQQRFITNFNLRKCNSPYCNKYFTPSCGQQRFCSDKCQKENQKLMFSNEIIQDKAQEAVYPNELMLKCSRIEQRFRDKIKKSKNKAQIKMLRSNLKKLQASKKEIVSARKLAYNTNKSYELSKLYELFEIYLNNIANNIKNGNFKVNHIIIPDNTSK